MTILLFILLLNSLNFLFCKTPLSMGMMLLIQTILISMNSGILNHSFWFSYILFMIMLGGMLVLFIYITSLTSNLKFKFNKKIIFMNILYFIIIIFFLFFNYKHFYWNLNNWSFNMMENFEMNHLLKISLKKMFYYPNYKILIIMINYMLLTLLIVVKIIKINKGPIRKMNNI
uniref:NADH-ubiquinone oxidoreductase chain 6 n=1 Tax=Leptocimbex clavicornis TaxID=2738386 RepID=A0A8A3SRM4_9HYME|nr:NADH dehydrogenase subunit 6 [Leptocimbex clavicornis]